jgi:hypothetical protein
LKIGLIVVRTSIVQCCASFEVKTNDRLNLLPLRNSLSDYVHCPFLKNALVYRTYICLELPGIRHLPGFGHVSTLDLPASATVCLLDSGLHKDRQAGDVATTSALENRIDEAQSVDDPYEMNRD